MSSAADASSAWWWLQPPHWSLLSWALLTLVAYALYVVTSFAVLQPFRRYVILRRQGVRGPTFIPLLGQGVRFNESFTKSTFLHWGVDHIRRYGDPFQYCLGPFTILHIADPDLILAAWKTQHSHYHKGVFAKTMLGPLLGAKSLVLVDEPLHGHNRQMISPAFHFSHLRSMTSIIVDETLTAIHQLFTPPSSSPSPSPDPASARVELHRWFTDLSLNVIVSSSFGNSLTHIPNAKSIIHHSLTTVLDLMLLRSLTMVGQIPLIRDLPILGKRETDRGKAELARVVSQMVQDRKAGRSHSNCEGADLLDLLLSARDAHSGEAFSDEQVQADAMTYILAGHDTTSALMTWLMRDLGMRPKLWAECRAEVERVTEGGELREEHLSALTLLTACIYESSRLRPPVPVVSLQASVDHLLTPEGGKPPLFVPKDTNLFSDAYAVHRSTELWGPTAGEWDEQRWVKGSASYHKPKHPAAFNTFSLGTRSCIGSQFALMEAKVMTALLLRSVTLEIEPGQSDALTQKISVQPAHGLYARLTRV